MDIEFLMKAIGIAMTVAISCQILSRIGRDDQSSLVSLGGVIVMLLLLLSGIGELFNTVWDIFGL
jgi:stage III sporulation protein AC